MAAAVMYNYSGLDFVICNFMFRVMVWHVHYISNLHFPIIAIL